MILKYFAISLLVLRSGCLVVFVEVFGDLVNEMNVFADMQLHECYFKI